MCLLSPIPPRRFAPNRVFQQVNEHQLNSSEPAPPSRTHIHPFALLIPVCSQPCTFLIQISPCVMKRSLIKYFTVKCEKEGIILYFQGCLHFTRAMVSGDEIVGGDSGWAFSVPSGGHYPRLPAPGQTPDPVPWEPLSLRSQRTSDSRKKLCSFSLVDSKPETTIQR